jgi:dihydroxyacetone kinase
MSSKHFINDPIEGVLASLHANTIVNPTLAFDSDHKIIYRDIKQENHVKVSILSGGGSGHEPGFAGYVGKGLLTASVAGTIFASPSADQVSKGFGMVPTGGGVLVLIMNYTGDVLNFGMAVEDAKANDIQAELFAVGDDVAVGRVKGGKVGRRGLAGTVLVVKLCGALAEMDYSLSQVYQLARQAAGNIVTIGASLDHVHVPGRTASVCLPASNDEIELGMGIHNEPGCGRVQKSLPELVETMLQNLLDQGDSDRGFSTIKPKDDVVLLINNLGGVSALEIGSIVTEVVKQLRTTYDLRPLRVYAGPFLTSLNGSGFSISLLKIEETGFGEGRSMLDLLDFPCESVNWPSPLPRSAWEMTEQRQSTTTQLRKTITGLSSQLSLNPGTAKSAIEAGLHRLILAEPQLTHYDTIVGDGDCGIGMKRGATAVLASLTYPHQSLDAVSLVANVKAIVETAMDGTSGALFTIFLSSMIQGLRRLEQTNPGPVNAAGWADVLQYGLQKLANYTPARPGDRTLMDALVPFVEVLASTLDVKKAADAATNGAEKTKKMKASLGRSVYIGSEHEWAGKIPDPGAWAVSELLQGMASTF